MADLAPVAALYVDPRGPYPALVAEWWDEARDARRYAGPLPVVAHPPCGPWGRLRFLCTKQDPSCGPAAVDAVRRWGGVLEHPADSRLWWHCAMSLPGEFADAHGGWTVQVRQVSWGHACAKPTWIYIVGHPSVREILDNVRHGGLATHRITSGPRGPRLPSASTAMCLRTPIQFARWLISIAASCRA